MSERGLNPDHGTYGENGPEESLRAALDHLATSEARPEFRAQLREKFLGAQAAGPVAGFGAGVWDSQAVQDGSAGNRKANVTKESSVANTGTVSNTANQFQSLLDTWTPGDPSAAFRDSLRERFLGSGETLGRSPEAEVAEVSSSVPPRVPTLKRPAREPDPASRRPPVSARSQRRKTWSLVGASVGLAAAALLVVAFLPFGKSGNPAENASSAGWSLLSGGQVATVDGQTVDASAFAPLDEGGFALASAPQRVTAGQEVLRLRYADQMVLELEPGSSLDVSDLTEDGHADGEWVLTMQGTEGGYRVATLDGFRRDKRRLLFRTPEAEVEVVGTVFGVDRYPNRGDKSGTCVCCCDGEVQVRSLVGGESGSVTGGGSNFIYANNGSMNPMDRMPGPHGKPLEILATAFHSH